MRITIVPSVPVVPVFKYGVFTNRRVGYELWFIDINEKASGIDFFISGRKFRKDKFKMFGF
jgi:hypothetical protein